MVIQYFFSLFFLVASYSHSYGAYKHQFSNYKKASYRPFCNSKIIAAIDAGDFSTVYSFLADFTPHVVNKTLSCTKNKYHCTPLTLAVQRRKIYIVRKLLEAGASVRVHKDYDQAIKQGSFGIALLLAATNNHCLKIATELMDRDEHLVHAAITLGDYSTLESLLNDDKHVDVVNDRGETPLMHAAHCGDASAVRLLLSKGVSVYAYDDMRQGVMHHAVHGGDVECVRLLLEADAPFDKNSDLDVYPDGLACKKNRYDLAVLLQDHDENMLMQSIIFKNASAVQRCLDAGYRLDYRLTDDDRMPLHMAVKFYNKEVMDSLLRSGAARIKNFADVTPLQKAIRHDMLCAAVDIIISGAEIDERTLLGSTALHMAVEQKNYAITALLLEAGASLDAKDMLCQTPLEIAVDNADTCMVNILLHFIRNKRK